MAGCSLCRDGSSLHGNQLTQCQRNNFLLRWINEGGGVPFQFNPRRASSTAEIQLHNKVSKPVAGGLSKEKLRHNSLDFCKISLSFIWGSTTKLQALWGCSWCIRRHSRAASSGQHLLLKELNLSVLGEESNSQTYHHTGTKSVPSNYTNVSTATAFNRIKISPGTRA